MFYSKKLESTDSKNIDKIEEEKQKKQNKSSEN